MNDRPILDFGFTILDYSNLKSKIQNLKSNDDLVPFLMGVAVLILYV